MNYIVNRNIEGLEVVEVSILPNHNKLEVLEDGTQLEFITLKDTVSGEKENYVVEVGSDFWFEIKCVEIPQKIARKHKAKGGRHFDEADLISYLTEVAYKKLVKFDREKVDYYESFMRRWLGKNVVDFFRESKIDKITDLEVTFMSKNADEEEGVIDIFDEPIDIWAELHSELELEEIIEGLDPEEQIIVRRLLDGFNASEIARELGTYKMKVSRHIKSIVQKAQLEKKQDRTTKRVSNLASTTTRETHQSVKAYNKLMDKLALENRILGGTINLWNMERALEDEVLKVAKIENEEERLLKEAGLRTKAEVIQLFAKELQELEKKLDKLNK